MASTWEELDIGDYILAVLYYAGRPLSKTHIMKILAFYAVLTGREDYFDYAPYRLGLYSPEVDSVLDEGLYEARLVERGHHGYRLTAAGWREARRAVALLEKADREDAELLKKLAQRLSRLSTDEILLLHYVMLCSEECRRISDKWRSLEGRRAEIALKLLEKGRVSWRLAARLAGLSLEEFARLAEQRGVKVGDKLYIEDIAAAIKDHQRLRLRRRLGNTDNS